MMSSSAILEICIEQTETLNRKSKTKSLSETVSIELFVGFLKPSFFVVKFLSMLKKYLLTQLLLKDFHLNYLDY